MRFQPRTDGIDLSDNGEILGSSSVVQLCPEMPPLRHQRCECQHAGRCTEPSGEARPPVRGRSVAGRRGKYRPDGSFDNPSWRLSRTRACRSLVLRNNATWLSSVSTEWFQHPRSTERFQHQPSLVSKTHSGQTFSVVSQVVPTPQVPRWLLRLESFFCPYCHIISHRYVLEAYSLSLSLSQSLSKI